MEIREIPEKGLGSVYIEKGVDLNDVLRYAFEDVGYRMIDCAKLYANQKEVGAALRSVFSRGNVKREDVWVTSKLWSHMHNPDCVERACRDTLEELGLEYLDLYLMHHSVALRHVSDDNLRPVDEEGRPLVDRIPIAETWKAMEELVDKGLVRHIGVSNFTIPMLEKLRFCPGIRIQPYTNQIEFHLYMQQEPMRHYLKQRCIRFSAFSPLGAPGSLGLRSSTPILEDPVLLAISKEIGQTPAATELKFLRQLCADVVLIVKSSNKERLRANFFDVDKFDLNEEQMERLKARERCRRLLDFQSEFREDIMGDGW
jgi:aldehyde reductase